MNRDRLFQQPGACAGGFVFDAAVAAVFDDMLQRSIPHYDEQQRMLVEMARAFWRPGTCVYDLGCSTGTTLLNVARALDGSARLVGYDNASSMLERAARNVAAHGLTDRVELRLGDLNDISGAALTNASLVTMCWTLQFVRPVNRDLLVRAIHDALVPRGALIVTEKVLADDTTVARFFIDAYHDLKRRNGYSEIEIARKRDALENVLIPLRLEENRALFRRCGFTIVETFFQWYNFVGFLCVKGPGPSQPDPAP
jgi:tRNA (cmo5U34)-methyltransferase